MAKQRKPSHAEPRHAIRRALLYFALFFLLEVAWENKEQYEPEGSLCGVVSQDATPFLYESAYPWLMHHLLGRQASGRVAVVFIAEDLTEVQQNLCRGREYMARLVDTLAAQRPATIVLDKFFSTKSCQADAAEQHSTVLLQDAVKAASKAGIAVVIGEATSNGEVKKNDTCLVKKADTLSFENTKSGLTKLNVNREQIPLRWSVFDSQRSKAEPMPSLSLVAASTIAPGVMEGSMHRAALYGTRQPYARLDLPIVPVSSADLLHGGVPLESFRKKVVVVGAQSAGDRWAVLGQLRWGYELQAAYVDALVSGHYLRAVPGVVIVGLSVLFVAVLEGFPFFWRWWHAKGKADATHATLSWWWFLAWSGFFAGLVVAICSPLHYFPPLSVVMAVCTTAVARLLLCARDYFADRSPRLEVTR